MYGNKVIVYIKNKIDASSYYRIYQYISKHTCNIVSMTNDFVYHLNYNTGGNSFFKRVLMGISTNLVVIFSIINDLLFLKSDILIINRRFFPRFFPKILYRLLETYLRNRKVYWDFDDNILFDQEITNREFKLLEKYSYKIVVSTNFLKQQLDPEFHKKVIVLPTTDTHFINVNVQEALNNKLNLYDTEIRMVWVGTKNNLTFLNNILSYLELAAKECYMILGKSLVLSIISNYHINSEYKYLKISNVIWERELAINYILNSHIGLMPLDDTEYTKGKAAFKAIQYMAGGTIPIISSVGYNKNIIQHDEEGFIISTPNDWIKYILLISEHKDKYINMALCTRKRWENQFNPYINYYFWKEVIKND